MEKKYTILKTMEIGENEYLFKYAKREAWAETDYAIMRKTGCLPFFVEKETLSPLVVFKNRVGMFLSLGKDLLIPAKKDFSNPPIALLSGVPFEISPSNFDKTQSYRVRIVPEGIEPPVSSYGIPLKGFSKVAFPRPDGKSVVILSPERNLSHVNEYEFPEAEFDEEGNLEYAVFKTKSRMTWFPNGVGQYTPALSIFDAEGRDPVPEGYIPLQIIALPNGKRLIRCEGEKFLLFEKTEGVWRCRETEGKKRGITKRAREKLDAYEIAGAYDCGEYAVLEYLRRDEGDFWDYILYDYSGERLFKLSPGEKEKTFLAFNPVKKIYSAVSFSSDGKLAPFSFGGEKSEETWEPSELVLSSYRFGSGGIDGFFWKTKVSLNNVRPRYGKMRTFAVVRTVPGRETVLLPGETPIGFTEKRDFHKGFLEIVTKRKKTNGAMRKSRLYILCDEKGFMMFRDDGTRPVRIPSVFSEEPKVSIAFPMNAGKKTGGRERLGLLEDASADVLKIQGDGSKGEREMWLVSIAVEEEGPNVRRFTLLFPEMPEGTMLSHFFVAKGEGDDYTAYFKTTKPSTGEVSLYLVPLLEGEIVDAEKRRYDVARFSSKKNENHSFFPGFATVNDFEENEFLSFFPDMRKKRIQVRLLGEKELEEAKRHISENFGEKDFVAGYVPPVPLFLVDEEPVAICGFAKNRETKETYILLHTEYSGAFHVDISFFDFPERVDFETPEQMRTNLAETVVRICDAAGKEYEALELFLRRKTEEFLGKTRTPKPKTSLERSITMRSTTSP